jgi:50S ribosomal subunit-associated GTPase HflX
VLIFAVKSLQSKVNLMQISASSNEMLINQLQTLFIELETSSKNQLSLLKTKNTELEQVTRQLEHRIKNLQEQLSRVEKLQEQQPEDKLYSRAFKLVELGAPVEEIVKECEIPRAEAEILISIHQKQSV